MSLDQFVACRRAPKLPDDLPQAAEWTISMFEGEAIYTFKGRDWLINLMIEPEFPEELHEQLVDDLVRRTVEPCKRALTDAGLTPNEIDEVPVLRHYDRPGLPGFEEDS